MYRDLRIRGADVPSHISETYKFRNGRRTSIVGALCGSFRWLSCSTCRVFVCSATLLAVFSVACPLSARTKEKLSYGEGLIINIPMPIAQVEIVVGDVAGNGVIRGTKEYNKDQYVSGAQAADSPHVFTPWTEGGKVFYKVRTEALDPVNFKDSNDEGTLEVRYVLKPQGEKNTVLRIDALFQEDFRRSIHPSNGSVETAEYKDIREHLDAIEVMKQQDEEAQRERQEKLAKKQNPSIQQDSSSSSSSGSFASDPGVTNAPPGGAEQNSNGSGSDTSATPMRAEVPYSAEVATNPTPSGENRPLTLDEQIKALRLQVERIVKSPGAPLKSAPFHTANTLQLLSSGTEVLVVIDTPYWYGVETHDGQHGWMMRDELEQKP